MNKAFQITNIKLLEQVINSTEYGVLSMVAQKPYSVAVNHIYYNNALYFHGSLKGKKMEIIRNNNNVCFNLVSDHNIIPSYVSSDGNLACPATAFFKSVFIEGKAEEINNIQEKRDVFTIMMKKLQPKGGYISFDSNEYDRALKKVAIVKINIESISGKFKFGQNYTKEKFQLIIDNLKKSNCDIDKTTISNMEYFYPKK